MNYTMNDICDSRDHPAARRKFIFEFNVTYRYKDDRCLVIRENVIDENLRFPDRNEFKHLIPNS